MIRKICLAATAAALAATVSGAAAKDRAYRDANGNLNALIARHAYQVAGGNPSRAVHYYAAGYYYAAKSQRRGQPAEASAFTVYALAAPAGTTDLYNGRSDVH